MRSPNVIMLHIPVGRPIILTDNFRCPLQPLQENPVLALKQATTATFHFTSNA